MRAVKHTYRPTFSNSTRGTFLESTGSTFLDLYHHSRSSSGSLRYSNSKVGSSLLRQRLIFVFQNVDLISDVCTKMHSEDCVVPMHCEPTIPRYIVVFESTRVLNIMFLPKPYVKHDVLMNSCKTSCFSL